MEAYRTDAVVRKDGTVTIGNLPFREGQKVEVILLQRDRVRNGGTSYALRGEPVEYLDPFEGVAVDEWENAD